MDKIKIGIIGGTGYTGVELLRLLATHPWAQVEVITSRSEAGRPVAEMFPSLRGFTDLKFSQPLDGAFSNCDVVFSATPNGIAMTHARGLMEQGVKLIDLAADFRIRDLDVWQQYYGMEHACPELVEQAVYGLPELNRKQIKSANLVANPGCYPTATTLGLLPLVSAGLVNCGSLISDSKSGVTGAGRAANVANLYSEVADSFKAYGVAAHRHQPEIAQNLAGLTEQEIGLTFVPHLTPMLRGIHATLYADLLEPKMPLGDIQALFESSYQHETFVDVLPQGACPDTRSVKSSNYCRIAVHQSQASGKVIVLSVIDNLTKGAAGQAIQNMNIMFDINEGAGLQSPALLP